MKLSNKMTLSLATLGVVVVIGAGSAYAATTIGTVTGKDGDVKDKISMNAEIIESQGSHVTLKDLDSGKAYETSIGPSWYSGNYSVGEKVTIEGVETTEKNDNGHNFQTMTIEGKTLRENFESKPAWAGQKGNSEGNGEGTRGQGNKANFIDTNGDGQCDNR